MALDGMRKSALPLAYMAGMQSAMIGVGVSLAQFRDLVVILCRTWREGLICLLRGLAAATFSAASGKAPALLQPR